MMAAKSRMIARAFLIATLGVGLGSLPALAEHQGGLVPRWGRQGTVFYFLFKGARLTPDQESKVRDVLKAHRARSRDLFAQLRAAQAEMIDKLLAPGSVTAEDLQPLRQRIAQLWQLLSRDRLDAALKIRAVLTPEQVARVEQLKDRYRQLHREMEALLEEQ